LGNKACGDWLATQQPNLTLDAFLELKEVVRKYTQTDVGS
jgi:hypothetical protein